METCVKVFNDFLLYEKNSSNNTVESYMRDINQFAAFCTGNNILKINQIDNSFIVKYLDYLTKLGKSEATKLRIVASLRSFFRCLNSKGLTDDNPANNINIKKTEKQLPGILDEKEIVLFLNLLSLR